MGSVAGPYGMAAGAIIGGVMGGINSSQGSGSSNNPTNPLNYQQMLQQALAGSSQEYNQKIGQITDNYGNIQNQQLGTVNSIYKKLAVTPYQQAAQAGALAGLSRAGNIQGLADQFATYGKSALANSGPNSLEQGLYDQAASNLALGSQLSPEEQRQATQMANSQYSANGFGSSDGAAATGILNRYSLGQQRQAQRQSQATAADNLYTQNPLARAQGALGALGQGAASYGQAASTGYQGANTMSALNPYTQALGYGTALAGQNLATQTSLMNPSYMMQNENAFNVPSFNANMQTANWAAQQNLNQANNASQMSVLGAGLGSLGKIGAAYASNPNGGWFGSSSTGSNGQYYPNI